MGQAQQQAMVLAIMAKDQSFLELLNRYAAAKIFQVLSSSQPPAALLLNI